MTPLDTQRGLPMKISTKCPNCDKTFKVEEQHVGRKGRCPACQSPFVVSAVQERPEAKLKPSERVDADIESARTVVSGTIGTRQLVIAGIGGFVGAVFVTLFAVYMLSSSAKHTPVAGQPIPLVVKSEPEPTVDKAEIEPMPQSSQTQKPSKKVTSRKPSQAQEPSTAPEAITIVYDRTQEQIDYAKNLSKGVCDGGAMTKTEFLKKHPKATLRETTGSNEIVTYVVAVPSGTEFYTFFGERITEKTTRSRPTTLDDMAIRRNEVVNGLGAPDDSIVTPAEQQDRIQYVRHWKIPEANTEIHSYAEKTGTGFVIGLKVFNDNNVQLHSREQTTPKEQPVSVSGNARTKEQIDYAKNVDKEISDGITRVAFLKKYPKAKLVTSNPDGFREYEVLGYPNYDLYAFFNDSILAKIHHLVGVRARNEKLVNQLVENLGTPDSDTLSDDDKQRGKEFVKRWRIPEANVSIHCYIIRRDDVGLAFGREVFNERNHEEIRKQQK